MKKMQYVLILLLYSCFILLKAYGRFWDSILFLKYLYKTDFVKRRAAKFGVKDGYRCVRQILENSKSGFYIYYSGLIVSVWGILVVWGILNFTNFFSDNRFYGFVFESKLAMIIGFIVFLSTIYFSFERIMYKNDVYLEYFRLFESKAKNRRIKEILIGSFVLIAGFAFFVVSIAFIRR